MNCLITFAVVFSIIIVDTYESFGFKQLKKLSVTEKRTIEDVVDVEEFEIDSTQPCPVIECVVVTDGHVSQHFSEERIKTDVKEAVRLIQEEYLDELELNLTLRLIGHIFYTNETEPDYIKESLYNLKTIAGNILSNMRAIKDHPLVSRADAVVLLTTRDAIYSLPKPGEEPSYIGGLAYLGAACNPDSKFALALFSHLMQYMVDTFIHELGHLININHDWEAKNCSPKLLPGKKRYSYCAKKGVTEFLDTHSCFLDHCDNGEK
ncbi:venom metalloproteinase antarease TserMP_A-like isoform X3 [Centruroides sculpturatus]|uniref:venom metalloproteinase antarease TserMP_A-like isoform X3 n=1 Tax=Centruroides sculpturatus TaxID=218467 RepID=UPI000C6D45FC|nr:venom metalloproteinase antarease TserMP_A-like isoform X3 [Centruroides sculpturatus]